MCNFKNLFSFQALNLDFYPIYFWTEPKLSQGRSAALQKGRTPPENQPIRALQLSKLTNEQPEQCSV